MKTNFNLTTTDTNILKNLAQDIHIELNARIALKRKKSIKDFQAAFYALKDAGLSLKYKTGNSLFTIEDWDDFTFTSLP